MTGPDTERDNGTRAQVDAEERALVTTPLGRWRWPLALAALAVAAVALGLQWLGAR